MFVDCWFEVDVKNVMEGRGGDQARFFMWIQVLIILSVDSGTDNFECEST